MSCWAQACSGFASTRSCPHSKKEAFGLNRNYQRELDRLLEQKLVYPCICSRRDVQRMGAAPHAGDFHPYDGRCRGRFRSYDDFKI